MIRLTNWTARRSGATITVTGLNMDDGKSVARLAGVRSISAKEIDGRIAIVAAREFGEDVELLTN
jgi:hypothetical protein